MMYQNYKAFEKATTKLMTSFIEEMQEFGDGIDVIDESDWKEMEYTVRALSAFMTMIKEEAQTMDRLNKVLDKLEEKEKEKES